ncbi:PhzF family phenazine biosynthesis protein [Listeria fleischmannii]|uniref:PhzF family phenazine biosynthesis protein n=1 Tax=Listeria fleischmannii TaxID=1069827 RepID=UPI003B9877F0
MENNLSETAFLVQNNNQFDLRWFTPGGEVNLCGHATLAAAHVLYHEYYDFINKKDPLVFNTKSGQLMVNREDEIIYLDFPKLMPSKIELSADMELALNAQPSAAYLDRDLVFIFENEEQVINLMPDFTRMKSLSQGIGVLVTAPGKEFDFVSRTFFPKLNVNEDPVCGSAHSNFIPYWAQKLKKDVMLAKQLSSRPGILYCENKTNRVKIGGKAILYAKAQINEFIYL